MARTTLLYSPRLPLGVKKHYFYFAVAMGPEETLTFRLIEDSKTLDVVPRSHDQVSALLGLYVDVYGVATSILHALKAFAVELDLPPELAEATLTEARGHAQAILNRSAEAQTFDALEEGLTLAAGPYNVSK